MMTSRSGRRWRILFALVALYALAGFFLLPPIVKPQIEERLSTELQRHVTIGRVRVNPFALSFSLEHLEVSTPEGAGSLFGWDRLYVNFDALASLRGDWVLSEISLAGFHAAVEVRSDGALNFSDLIEKYSRVESHTDPHAKPGRAWRFGRIEVAEARVDFIDRSRAEAFSTLVGPVNFTLLDFRTVGGRGAPYRFEARTESGEKLSWIGTLSAAPLASAGEWRIENLLLPKYAPYFQDQLEVILTEGKVTAGGQYELSLAPENRRLVLKDGLFQIKKLRLIDRLAGQPVMALAELEVTGISADAFASKFSAGAVHLNGGRVSVRRERDGSLNLFPPVAPRRAASAPPRVVVAGAVSTKPPEVAVQEVALRDFDIEWVDLTTPRPVHFELTHVNATVKNFTLAGEAPMAVNLTFGCLPQGTVNIAGHVSLAPLRADVDLEAAWLPLAPLSPILERAVAARVKRGTASLKGHATLAFADGVLAGATFAGDGRVEDFALLAATGDEELAGFAEFAARGLKIGTAPRLAVSVDELKLGAPFAHVVVAEDKTINLLGLMHSPAAIPAVEFSVGLTAPAASAVEAWPELTIARLVIDGGDFSFADHSVRPAVGVALKEVGGTFRGLSSLHPESGEVELHAKVDGASPITISGRLNPLAENPIADLKVKFESVNLMPANPYVGKYAGYELEKGTLFVDTDARLAARKLDLHNTITLDQFTLGRATNSPDAVKLPVRLGVALLKDASGKIVLDLPVQGSLDDPQFQLGPVVGRVFTNLLTKAATSPFALLGSMFGGGGEELGQQEFLPGESTLTPDDLKKLATVERALEARPALRLELEGGYDAAADRVVLAQAKLDDLVRQRVAEERRAQGANAVSTQELLVSDQEHAAMIERLFGERFTTDRAQAAIDSPATTPPSKAGVKAPPHRGFFRRTIDVVTFRGARERRAQRKEKQEQPHADGSATTKPGGKSEAAKPAVPPLGEMTSRLADTMTVTAEELSALAGARAQRVRDQLIAKGKITADRVAMTKPDAKVSEKIGARVTLHLR